ncbi:MAG: AhpC/TSA family protein [Candidatus Koribacter versatilis]|uniref:AhpC/TSA family protein n=1 Tax=Candidatus Korobacter versatilis TaxID=658062 RepID=A0A932A6K5_9BACT|nr:AhpC/TSA family protein [Candidatus Koribacter versatilis]
MRAHQQEFSAKGARIAAIGLGGADYARLFREETGITFPLLIDEQREAYRAAELRKANILHLFRGDNAKGRERAKAAGHRQHALHALTQDPFQLGASFVFGPGDVDRFMHASETFSDNAPVDDLLAAVP